MSGSQYTCVTKNRGRVLKIDAVTGLAGDVSCEVGTGWWERGFLVANGRGPGLN